MFYKPSELVSTLKEFGCAQFFTEIDELKFLQQSLDEFWVDDHIVECSQHKFRFPWDQVLKLGLITTSFLFFWLA